MENKIYNDSNPWLGLAPYQEGIPLYGRTKECVILSEIIKNNYVSVVFGKSGIGRFWAVAPSKSSNNSPVKPLP